MPHYLIWFYTIHVQVSWLHCLQKLLKVLTKYYELSYLTQRIKTVYNLRSINLVIFHHNVEFHCCGFSKQSSTVCNCVVWNIYSDYLHIRHGIGATKFGCCGKHPPGAHYFQINRKICEHYKQHDCTTTGYHMSFIEYLIFV